MKFLRRAQWLVWSIIYALLLLYSVRDGVALGKSIFSSTVNFIMCLLAIYGQSAWLIPKYRHHLLRYSVLSILVLTFLVLLKAVLEYLVLNRFYGNIHFYDLSIHHFSLILLTLFLCSLIGILLRTSLDHIALLERQKEIVNQQLTTELRLLKQQVQPHFMFNTLNNIYSLVYQKSDRAPEAISTLSDVMRYFVHEAIQERIAVRNELSFIQSYINLERLRLSSHLHVEIHVDEDVRDVQIPPMIMIPFVENFFKHGLIKRGSNNEFFIHISRNQNRLQLCFKNALHLPSAENPHASGLKNLRRRLELLYGAEFSLDYRNDARVFSVHLSIPTPK